MGKKTVLSEQAMQRLEQSIPEMAGPAFRRAYLHALSSAGKVLVAVGGQLVEVSADSQERVIKALPKPTPVVPGTKRLLSRRPIHYKGE
jgi:uncharacterized membrane protein